MCFLCQLLYVVVDSCISCSQCQVSVFGLILIIGATNVVDVLVHEAVASPRYEVVAEVEEVLCVPLPLPFQKKPMIAHVPFGAENCTVICNTILITRPQTRRHTHQKWPSCCRLASRYSDQTQDLHSTNGTYVVNAETEDKTRLAPKKAMMLPRQGCRIHFGGVVCKVCVQGVRYYRRLTAGCWGPESVCPVAEALLSCERGSLLGNLCEAWLDMS